MARSFFLSFFLPFFLSINDDVRVGAAFVLSISALLCHGQLALFFEDSNWPIRLNNSERSLQVNEYRQPISAGIHWNIRGDVMVSRHQLIYCILLD